MRVYKYLFLVGLLLMLLSCNGQTNDLLADDISLFKGEAWDLAKAVESEDPESINKIVSRNKEIIDYQEPKFGQSLLMWAVRTNRYNSVKALLDNGANPNLQDTYDGTSAVMLAAGYGPRYDTNPDILKLLLKYGGDPNAEQKGSRQEGNSTRKTPLLIAASCCMEKTKVLVDAGADINYSNEFNESIIRSAMSGGKDAVYITRYLLIEKGANVPKSFGVTQEGYNITILDYLRNWLFPINSNEYKGKMEIVSYLKDKGFDYWSTPIPKKYYKNYPKEYLEKY